MDCIWVNLKSRPTFFQIYGMSVKHVSKCHLYSLEIILSSYVAVILQMKDSWSANLTFTAHNEQNETKLPKIA